MSIGASPPLLGLSIPLYDEEDVVEAMVAELVAALDSASIQFVLALVDNGSKDRTGELVEALAKDPRILALRLPENAGYGGGILAGLRSLSEGSNPEILGWTWGDGQVDPTCIAPLYRACIDGSPLAKAVRTEREDGTFRAVQAKVYTWILGRMGQSATDPHGCPKLFRREALQELDLQHTDWFLDAEAMLGAADRGWDIAETPVKMRARTGGQSKVRFSTALEFCGNLQRWKQDR
jgi:glycosyltransferase involved in cell wall biosynthesis